MIVIVMITVIVMVVIVSAIYTYLDSGHQFQLYVIGLDWWPFQLQFSQTNPPEVPKLKPRVRMGTQREPIRTR
jgi:hypothetical protein